MFDEGALCSIIRNAWKKRSPLLLTQAEWNQRWVRNVFVDETISCNAILSSCHDGVQLATSQTSRLCPLSCISFYIINMLGYGYWLCLSVFDHMLLINWLILIDGGKIVITAVTLMHASRLTSSLTVRRVLYIICNLILERDDKPTGHV